MSDNQSAFDQTVDPVADRKARLKTMRLSVLEGIVAMIAIGLQQTFYIPFLNRLGASNLEIGIAAGLPSLMTGLIQLGVPRWLQKAKSYQKVLVVSCALHGICYLPLAVVAYFHGPLSIWASMACIAVSAASFGFGNGCWSDWMGLIVPRRRRGIYFARRNRIVGLFQLATSILAGYWLDHWVGKTMLVFSLLWLIAFFARTASAFMFYWHYEPPQIRQGRQAIRFRTFLSGITEHSFGRFTIAISLVHFSANFSAPFFPLYMLNELKLTYSEYTILTLIPSVVTIATMGLWGRVCDRFGYMMPMRLQVAGVVGLPLVWIITQQFWALAAVQVVAGLAWGGMTLASFGYSIQVLNSAERLSYLSYLNFISNVLIFLGTFLGGLFGSQLPPLNGSVCFSVFLASTLMRLVPLLLFQTLPQDSPPRLKMSTLERFFFDPQLTIRAGFDRLMSSRVRRPI